MRRRASCVVVFCVAIQVLGVSPVWAQFMQPNLAIGENYRVELFGGLWNPTPEITISSEQLGIPGSDIDVVADLGVLQKRFREFRAVVRAARKHKFRVHFIPASYESDVVLERDLVFNGVRFTEGLPVSATARWNMWRFAYEYDFVYRSRGFVGFIVEAKYTDLDVALDSPLGLEFARARAPVPAVGGIGRAYLTENLAVTFELTGFKLPENINERYRTEYVDLDVYTTLNFTDNVGVQFGYRSVDALYRIDEDSGDLKLKGTYFGGLVRF